MVTVEPAALISIAPPQLGQLSALTAAAGAPAAGSSMGRHPPAFDRPQVGRRELGERHIPAVIEMGALLIALQAGAATARRSEVDARDRPAGDRGEGQLASAAMQLAPRMSAAIRVSSSSRASVP